jgi:hypothetical protein
MVTANYNSFAGVKLRELYTTVKFGSMNADKPTTTRDPFENLTIQERRPKIPPMMIDEKTAGILLVETIVALIIVIMFIVIRPKKPRAPQHPLPSKDPVRFKKAPADYDQSGEF